MKAKPLFVLAAFTVLAILSIVVTARRQHTGSSVTEQTFDVRGQVRSVDTENKIIRVAHEEIPDYMPAMTMPLSVKNAALLDGLSAGDEIMFELKVTEEDSWISAIERISSGNEPQMTPEKTLADREAERVQTGELVPDFTLLDQNGKTIRLSDFRGKAVLVTFIYTRCPLPNFCPLMSKNFADLDSRLRKKFPDQYQLISISMDPEFDRPEILRDYADRYEANTKNWSFATGELEQIDFVARLLGLYYAWEGGLISHDLRTVLIGPDGRLVQIWKSNVWTPYEVERAVEDVLSAEMEILPAQKRSKKSPVS